MKLTLTVFGRTSTLELWQSPPSAPTGVTPSQREALFTEWEKQRASAGSGTVLSSSPAVATSSTNRSRRSVGFAP